MVPPALVRRTPTAAAALLLAGCVATPPPQELRLAYASAREALEAGDYPTAIRRYEALLGASTGDEAVASALRLDHAHALLRVGEAARALEAARRLLATGPESPVAGGAQVVAAVAEHELAEQAIVEGAPFEAARARAQTALQSLGRLLREHPDQDAGGVLTVRIGRLRERLAALEIAQLRADLETGSAEALAGRAARILREYAGTVAVTGAQALLHGAAGPTR